MSAPCTCVTRQCARVLRSQSLRPSYASSLVSQQSRRQSRRWQSTEASISSNPKIAGIVDQISTLTLLETADLVSTLKSRLNIPDIPMGGFSAGPAQAAAPVVEEAEEAAPKAEEKTLFNVKLESFDAASKPKVIKEVKGLLGLSLVESKKFVESIPKVMKEAVPKEEAEKMIEVMKALGAVAKME